nr:helix-turn-helix transcriptional regulator [uncultured Solibaculum sp.]
MRKTLKELRKESGFTQGYVANALEVDQTTVSKWENGESLPRVETLLEIAKFYNVTLDMIELSKKSRPKK